MNNLVILPIIIPIIMGMLMVIFKKKIKLQRFLSILSIVLVGAVAISLMVQIDQAGIQVLHLGGWEAPFGVSLVADMFSVVLVLVTSIVSVCCLLYAFHSIGSERESYYFYPLFLCLSYRSKWLISNRRYF